jgi:hypothetical protein
MNPLDDVQSVSGSVPNRIWVPALVFTSACLIFLFVAFFVKTLSSDQREILNAVFSLLAGFATFFLGGTAFLRLTGNLAGLKILFSGTAGVAVFVLVLFHPLFKDEPKKGSAETSTPDPISETYSSDDLASGSCKNFSPWYTLCSPEKAEGWTIVSHQFQLKGDRTCNGWAECRLTDATARKVCYQFRMQGHDEDCGTGGNYGLHYSRGVLEVLWKQR